MLTKETKFLALPHKARVCGYHHKLKGLPLDTDTELWLKTPGCQSHSLKKL